MALFDSFLDEVQMQRKVRQNEEGATTIKKTHQMSKSNFVCRRYEKRRFEGKRGQRRTFGIHLLAKDSDPAATCRYRIRPCFNRSHHVARSSWPSEATQLHKSWRQQREEGKRTFYAQLLFARQDVNQMIKWQKLKTKVRIVRRKSNLIIKPQFFVILRKL